MLKLWSKIQNVVAWVSVKSGIRADYILHFSVCFGLSLIGLWWLAAIVGVGKEVKDSREGGSGWSWYDLLSDTIGILVGLTINTLIK